MGRASRCSPNSEQQRVDPIAGGRDNLPKKGKVLLPPGPQKDGDRGWPYLVGFEFARMGPASGPGRLREFVANMRQASLVRQKSVEWECSVSSEMNLAPSTVSGA